MKERLVIKNFGPIKSVDLELGKMTILIGEQATGKSTIAKVLAICRFFSFIVENRIGNFFGSSFDKGLKHFGLQGYEQPNTLINYENDDYEVIINSFSEEKAGYFLNIQVKDKSARFKNLISELEDWKIKNSQFSVGSLGILGSLSPSENFYRFNVMKVMDNPFFIPAERNVFYSDFLSKRLSNNALEEQIYDLRYISERFQKEIDINIINIRYATINNIPKFKNKNTNIFFELNQGASGYQSIIPIVLAVKYYTEFEKRSRTFIIEEPEINLFPSTQKKLFEFFVENINKNGHSFLIPTHSPYFLSAANDLLMAFKKGQIFPKEVMNLKIPKKYWLNPNDISVYELKKGKAKSIINKETGLITDNIIDDVSDEMNDNFDRILDIE